MSLPADLLEANVKVSGELRTECLILHLVGEVVHLNREFGVKDVAKHVERQSQAIQSFLRISLSLPRKGQDLNADLLLRCL